MANQWNSRHAIWHDLSVAQGRAVPAHIEHTVALDERPPCLAVPEDNVMANQWNSRHAIWHDLSVAQGRAVPAHIEHTVALDERPPPLAVPEDAEKEVQLQRLGGVQPPTNAPEKPDLAGITSMLRMVKEVEVVEENSTNVIISKLNPEVPEFVPKSIKLSKKISQDKETKINETDKFNLNGGRLDTDRLTPDEKKIIKDQLKSKICETSNATCAKVKRERNLAIATLLKLHCVSQAAPGTNEPTLKSPAYYEKCIGNNVEENAVSKKIDNGNQPKNETENLNMLKVQKWLDETKNLDNKAEKQNYKHKSLYLGAVTFKRKAPSKPISPSTPSSEFVREDTVFKPSHYSEELAQTYRERCKAREKVEQNIWTKLEIELKAKDEAIKNKQMTKPESS